MFLYIIAPTEPISSKIAATIIPITAFLSMMIKFILTQKSPACGRGDGDYLSDFSMSSVFLISASMVGLRCFSRISSNILMRAST